MNRLPAALMSLAIWLLPPGRKEWGQAMRGEFDQVTDGHREFGIGCLGASLRENIMTREGWARVAFGGIVVLAALLGLSGLTGLVGLIANPPKRPAMGVSSFLVIAGVMLMLAMIARGAVDAMAAPTNRFKLVEIGLKTAPKLLITFGLVSVVSLFSQAYFHAFIAPEWIGLESAKFFLSNDAVCCIVILLVGFVSQRGSRGLIISGLVGALTVTLTGVLAYYLDRKGLEGLFIASNQQAILLLLVAVSGAVFMWMERSVSSLKT